ncbi:MAG: response regulator [Sulfurimonadaceae bacterium]|nr:response regulator [Sulfurimonadaceae bacterium]
MTERLYIAAVDDEPVNLLLLEELARQHDYLMTTFEKPADLLEHMRSHPVDILLTDYMMPEINGVELLRECRLINPLLLSVVITAVSDSEEVKIQALEAGANDFLTKPINPVEFQLRIRNLATIQKSQRLLSDFNLQLKEKVEQATRELVQREHEALQVLSKTAEYKDPETGSHISRVAHYSKLMAEGVGLDTYEQELIFYASPLHDIGKVGINDAVMLKPGKLTPDEFEVMKGHSQIGYEILKSSKNPYLQAGAVIAHSHHEKFDGSGYPQGLKGEDIHIYGRITAIADVFDALTSERPYKKAWSFDDAIALISEQSGSHFDPELVAIFIDHIDTVKEIYTTFSES